MMHFSLQWRHNETDGVSNHQPRDCLLNSLFMHRSKKTSKLRVIGLCAGNSPVTGEFPAQRANNAENVSIWWRHHERCWKITAAPWSACHGNMQKFVHLVMRLWCRSLIEQIVSMWWDTLPSHKKTNNFRDNRPWHEIRLQVGVPVYPSCSMAQGVLISHCLSCGVFNNVSIFNFSWWHHMSVM